jgi:hypothetical protein
VGVSSKRSRVHFRRRVEGLVIRAFLTGLTTAGATGRINIRQCTAISSVDHPAHLGLALSSACLLTRRGGPARRGVSPSWVGLLRRRQGRRWAPSSSIVLADSWASRNPGERGRRRAKVPTRKSRYQIPGRLKAGSLPLPSSLSLLCS